MGIRYEVNIGMHLPDGAEGVIRLGSGRTIKLDTQQSADLLSRLSDSGANFDEVMSAYIAERLSEEGAA